MDQRRRLVFWTPSARDCLDEVIGFVAESSPVAAGLILEIVLTAADSLSDLSERGRIVPEIDDVTIREIFVYRYRLIYQVSSEQVRVLAVLHGAMDFEGALRSGSPSGLETSGEGEGE